ncbi:hypothetical protein AMECASPLE_025175 [Ameca splendens]|uniref:Uncharacterized protein n=1 Tax=Ameca splendens TaxID=208324 RepID=A0ABV0Z2I5_9TELE
MHVDERSRCVELLLLMPLKLHGSHPRCTPTQRNSKHDLTRWGRCRQGTEYVLCGPKRSTAKKESKEKRESNEESKENLKAKSDDSGEEKNGDDDSQKNGPKKKGLYFLQSFCPFSVRLPPSNTRSKHAQPS